MTGMLGVAVVGVGYWGPKLVRNFLAVPDVELRWVCDFRAGRRQYVAERFPGVPVTETLDRVLRDSAVHAVALATPVSTHAELACAALQAGKHVLVEKPLAGSVRECDRIIAAAAAAGRRVAVGHLFVYHPAVQRMRAGIEDGAIGTLCYVETARVNLGPPASEVNVLWDLLAHDLSISLHLIDSEPVAVTACGRAFLHPTLVDAAFVHVRFADGRLTQHHVSWLSPAKVRRVFVAGTAGSYRFDDTLPDAAKLRFVDQGLDTRRGGGGDAAIDLVYRPGHVVDVALSAHEPLRAECEAFVQTIRTGAPLPNDARAGRDVVRLLAAAERSLAGGSRTVDLREAAP